VRILKLMVVTALLSACAMPQTNVRSGSSQPGLVVKGAPADATLFVDGLPMGSAVQFNGKPNILTVLQGVHKVEVRSGPSVLFSEKVFFSDGETHTVSVVSGAYK